MPPASPPPLHSDALRFSKMHGAGNDFVILDLRDGRPPPDAALCQALADRHVGVGCDQLLTIEPPRSPAAVAAYRIWNADGSSSQQCGNGARCVAAWLVRDGAIRQPRFSLDSPSGTHAVEQQGETIYRIAMGVPNFEPRLIPLAGFTSAQALYSCVIDGAAVHFGAVSMGNPHAVIRVADIAQAPVATVGPALQRNGVFPELANIGFAQIVSRHHIRLRVFERGVGETLACGSGACAAVAVLVRQGHVDREVTVSLPGGGLRIVWPDDDAQITMAGPTAFVFDGQLC